jgi:hypothetical protein
MSLTYTPGICNPVVNPLSDATGEEPVVTLLTVSPTTLTAGGGSPTNLTSALSGSPLSSNTGILFQNTGHEVVVVQTGSGGSTTVSSDIGTTVQGQTVPAVSGGTQAASQIVLYGPYPSQYDRQDGTNDIEIDFGTGANVSGVVVLHIPGVI